MPAHLHKNCSSVDNTLENLYQIPVYQIRINATTPADWGPHELSLHFMFDEYPTSTANSLEWIVDAQIDYCLPKKWVAPANFQLDFVIGHKTNQV